MNTAYLLFLGIFLTLPVAFLVWVARPTRLQWSGIAAMLAITALVGVAWDQWMAASGIWHYDPAQVIGVWVGYIPAEEVAFILLIPIMAGLWVSFLNNRLESRRKLTAAFALLSTLIILVAVFLGKVEPTPQGADSSAYLVRLLAWTVPLILGQILLGLRILLKSWQVWGLGIFAPVILLSIGDVLALNGGVWVISPMKMLHFYLPGQLPLEEGLFFLTTTTLIVQGLILFLSPELRIKAKMILARFS